MRNMYEIIDSIASLTIAEAKTAQFKKNLSKALGIIIGGIASKVYYEPTLRITAGDGPVYSTLLLVSNIGINLVVNDYYDVIASQEYFDLWDMNTRQLIMPRWHLGVLGFSSFASAFCFAFLVLNNTSVESYFDFALQLMVYTAQHIIAVKDLYDLWPQWPAVKKAEAPFRQAQSAAIDQIDAALFNINKGFDRNTLAVENFFMEEELNEELNINYLVNWVEQQTLPEQAHSKSSLCLQITHGLTQIVGFVATFIGNIGYHNDTINGFLRLKFLSLSNKTAQVFASTCMIPVYFLGFTSTYKNIKKLFQLFTSGLNRDDIPLAIKKAPWFSAGCGGVLLVWSLFSYCSALSLLQDAIYGGNPDNPPQFSVMDSTQLVRQIYNYSTVISLILFNFCPVPEVLEFLARKFCVYFSGSQELKQQMLLHEFLTSMRNRAVKASSKIFVTEVKEEKHPNEINANDIENHVRTTVKPPRKCCCQIISDALRYYFWPSPKTDLNRPLINAASLQV